MKMHLYRVYIYIFTQRFLVAIFQNGCSGIQWCLGKDPVTICQCKDEVPWASQSFCFQSWGQRQRSVERCVDFDRQ
jgi:hypothetical protein